MRGLDVLCYEPKVKGVSSSRVCGCLVFISPFLVVCRTGEAVLLTDWLIACQHLEKEQEEVAQYRILWRNLESRMVQIHPMGAWTTRASA